MPDVVPPDVRSRMMAGIKGKDTKPELLLRKALHRLGFRFRLHDKRLPGRPDIVFPGRHAVIFVHGCFWHGHEGCKYFKVPDTRRDFWLDKIDSNRTRDQAATRALEDSGWRVAVVWECATRHEPVGTVTALERWLLNDGHRLDIGWP